MRGSDLGLTMTKKILVVDDEPDVLLLCRVNLEFEGYEVAEAQDGESALEAVASEQPDLILLDVMMPGMDGWQVLAALKADPVSASLPVVMLTAKVQERDQIRGWTGGVSDYVTKPFNPIALSQAIKRALAPGGGEESERRRRQMLEKLRLVQSDRST